MLYIILVIKISFMCVLWCLQIFNCYNLFNLGLLGVLCSIYWLIAHPSLALNNINKHEFWNQLRMSNTEWNSCPAKQTYQPAVVINNNSKVKLIITVLYAPTCWRAFQNFIQQIVQTKLALTACPFGPGKSDSVVAIEALKEKEKGIMTMSPCACCANAWVTDQ